MAVRPRTMGMTAGAVTLLASLVPYPTLTAPEWRIVYVDAKEHAVANLPVQQSWQNYSVESTGNTEVRRTSAEGFVMFPERSVWSPALLRLLGPVLSFLFRGGFHASFGPSTFLVPQCDVLDQGPKLATYEGVGTPSRVVLGPFDRSRIRAALPEGAMESPAECAAIEAQVRAAGA